MAHVHRTLVGWSEITAGDEWDKFVAINGGSVFHLWAWRKVLEGSYSRPLYFAYRDSEGTILAICPFFYRTGRRLSYLDSLPDSHTGGPIIAKQVSDDSQILTTLRKSVRFSPFNPVIAMRMRTDQARIIERLIRLRFRYTTTQLFLLDLHLTNPNHVWDNGFNKHDRQAVKHYEKQGAIFAFARSDDDFHRYLSLDKGFEKSRKERDDFLKRVRVHMGKRVNVILCLVDGEVSAGALTLRGEANSTLSLLMTATTTKSAKNFHSAVTYLNWQLINWAHENGIRFIDFGSYSLAGLPPRHHFFRLKARFELVAVPRYQFILPTSDLAYSLARSLGRIT